MKKKFLKKLFSLSLFTFLGFPVFVFAKDGPSENLKKFATKGGYDPAQTNLAQRVGDVLGVAYSVLGVIALILIVYAGFNWMLAQGNQDKIQESKRIIRNAVIGLAILLSAYTLTAFVVAALTS